MFKTLEYPGVKSNMYMINEYGTIYNIQTQRQMSEHIRSGYRIVQLMSKRGITRHYSVHRLVAYTFCTGYDKTLVANHSDGNKLNCYWKNLEWVTQAENVKHAITHNLVNHINGEDVNTSKITEKDAEFISAIIMYMDGNIRNTFLIVKLFIPEVTYRIIQNIRNGYTWKHISKKYFNEDSFEKSYHYSKHDIEFICELIVESDGDINTIVSKSKLFFKNGIKPNYIRSIIEKRAHSSISDKYFVKNQYRKRLTDQDVDMICKALIETNMDVDKTCDLLKDNNRITPERIRDIIKKESHHIISDKYF